MKNLLYKELRLALHPTMFIFLALSLMLFIPSYPYLVVFFYACLAIFFTCLSGRENKDVFYTLLLPIRKGDVVRARVASICLIQLANLLLCALVAILRAHIMPFPNASGMDANIALFGFAFLMLGLFNLSFLTAYYRKPDRIGGAFVKASILICVYVALLETACHILPFFRDRLDTPDPAFLVEKIVTLVAGALAYFLLTALAYRRSLASLEKQDL